MNRLLQAVSFIFLVVLAELSAAADDSIDESKLLRPINLTKINTDKDENDPHLSADGLQLYYSSNAAKKYDLMVSTVRRKMSIGNQAWPKGILVEGYIQTKADDRSAFVTPAEGRGRGPQYLYFATKKDLMPDANFDIYVALKLNAISDFTAPTPINSVCTDEDELHPWLTPEGKQLYFSRKTRDGWRILVASRAKATGGSGFDKPKVVDLPEGFYHPTITPDGYTMYMQGPLDDERSGLFRSRRTGGKWSKPEPLAMLNDPRGKTGDQSPGLSRDGTLLYFASDRPGGKGGLDIWVIATAELNRRK